MKIPKARYQVPKRKSEIMYFKGYNNSDLFDPEELKGMKNLSSDHFPLLSVRKPREIITTLTDPRYLLASEKLAWVDGLDFYYDGVKKGTLTTYPTSIVDFNKYLVIFPDKKYYDYVNDTWGSFTSPDIDYAAVSNNRIFGVKGSELYACKLGDFKTWDSFQGLTTDSYAADVATKGDFKGIINYANHITMIKPEVLHELYGNKPANYSIPEAFNSGGIDHRSLKEVQGLLYILGSDGIKTYMGGIPRIISDKLNKNYISGAAGTDGHKYYISLHDGSSYDLFVYTPKYDMWHREDNLNVINFAYYNGHLHALAADGNIYKLDSGSEVINWEAETQVFNERSNEKKNLKTIYVDVELETGSSLTIYIKKNSLEYKAIKTIISHGYRTYKIPIDVKGVHHFQIKLEGSGAAKVHNITKEFIVGGDV